MGYTVKYLKDVVTLTYSIDKCTGCGRCIEVCPRNVFALNNGRALLTDRDSCIECGACALNCRFGAIAVESGVGCAAAIINSIRTGGSPVCGCAGPGDACC